MREKQRGVYRKFKVERTDGSSAPGGKHEKCSYFVLDLEHDPFALAALRAYANACRPNFPVLAHDLDIVVKARPELCGCREALCPHMPAFGRSPNDAMEILLAHDEEQAQ